MSTSLDGCTKSRSPPQRQMSMPTPRDCCILFRFPYLSQLIMLSYSRHVFITSISVPSLQCLAKMNRRSAQLIALCWRNDLVKPAKSQSEFFYMKHLLATNVFLPKCLQVDAVSIMHPFDSVDYDHQIQSSSLSRTNSPSRWS